MRVVANGRESEFIACKRTSHPSSVNTRPLPYMFVAKSSQIMTRTMYTNFGYLKLIHVSNTLEKVIFVLHVRTQELTLHKPLVL